MPLLKQTTLRGYLPSGMPRLQTNLHSCSRMSVSVSCLVFKTLHRQILPTTPSPNPKYPHSYKWRRMK